MQSLSYLYPFVIGLIAVAIRLAMIAWPYVTAPRATGPLNVTDHWNPVPEEGQEPAPTGTPLSGWFQRVIASRLEQGETLEGRARALFSPPRTSDWGIKWGLAHCPLLVAVTPRRLLLFEFGYLTVKRFCSIGWEEIRYLIPPATGFLGTSGALRFGLVSGYEYKITFMGPLFSDEGMQQEQRLAAYLRWIAPRFASGPAQPSLAA